MIEPTADGFGILKAGTFKAGFAADTTDEDAAFLENSQVPINLSSFGTKIENAAWRTKPSWAVIARQDKAFDQRMLQDMAKRIGAKVTEVDASHALFFTQPDVIADVIDQAAKSTKQAAQ